ncbi:MAG: HAMP domain-containing protein [Chloroflexi bacterium]|nr:HAMP domain-containing protein [Chloroflexota bacterium]
MPLRLRLAILNALVVVGAILVLGTLTYVLLERSLAAEIDESLRTQANFQSTLFQNLATLPPRPQEPIPPVSVSSGASFHVQLLDTSGQVVDRTEGLGPGQLPVEQSWLEAAGNGEEVFATVRDLDRSVRVHVVPLVTEEEFLGYVQVARSLGPLGDALANLRRALLTAGGALVVVSIVVAWLLAGASLRPVGRITELARQIGLSGRLDVRLPAVGTRDEIARLVETFNGMMDRLEAAFTAQRRFVADASHELRTPLTTIRGNVDLLRRTGAVKSPSMREALEDVSIEAERMSRLVQGLLALARADAGHELVHEPVQLDELVRTVHREMQPVANGVTLALDTVEAVEVLGDADALKQLLLIFADNGVKYTPPGGTVTLGLRIDGGEATLTVADTGSGIEAEDLPHIFERFYRSRNVRSTGGTGLGLAIAQWVAEQHHGQVDAQSTPGVGSTFRLRLPATCLESPAVRSRPAKKFIGTS